MWEQYISKILTCQHMKINNKNTMYDADNIFTNAIEVINNMMCLSINIYWTKDNDLESTSKFFYHAKCVSPPQPRTLLVPSSSWSFMCRHNFHPFISQKSLDNSSQCQESSSLQGSILEAVKFKTKSLKKIMIKCEYAFCLGRF